MAVPAANDRFIGVSDKIRTAHAIEMKVIERTDAATLVIEDLSFNDCYFVI
jgi:hypothetical protein